MAPRTHGALAALVIAASACRISTGFVARPAPARLTASTTPGTTPDTTTEAPVGGYETAKDRIVFQAEMAALPGLTVEQARQRLKEYGHVGPVIVEELIDFHPGCSLGTVCSTSDEGGTFIDDEIVLRVNRATLAIPPPP
jgi:hypothetical protein